MYTLPQKKESPHDIEQYAMQPKKIAIYHVTQIIF